MASQIGISDNKDVSDCLPAIINEAKQLVSNGAAGDKERIILYPRSSWSTLAFCIDFHDCNRSQGAGMAVGRTICEELSSDHTQTG